MKLPLAAFSLPLPCGNIGEVFVIAQGLALRRLTLHSEMSATGFHALERIDAHEFAQLEEIRNAAGLFERLIQFLTRPDDVDVLPELFLQFRNSREISLEAGFGARHAAVFPH